MERRKLTAGERFSKYMAKALARGLRKKGMTNSGFYRLNATLCSGATFLRMLKGENVGVRLLADVADRLGLKIILVPKDFKEQTDEDKD